MPDINSSIPSDTIFRSKAQLVYSLALVYALMGWIGMALAVPPGYGSPVFPAAGLALASVLWFGPTALISVWLGSVLLNLSHFWSHSTLTPSLMAAAMVVATGASLQAGVGSWLVRHRQGPAWQTLERELDVLRFLLLGGVLAGVISSLIGVTALTLFDVIETTQSLYTGWNWYLGDVLGILVFAPLTLCLFNRDGELWRDRRRRIVIPMLLTLGLVALAFYGAARWERVSLDSQLEADSQIISKRIADRLVTHREVLASLKHFLEATPDFSFKQFELFTRITLQDNPDIFALSFNDLITDERRPTFESMMSRLSPLGPFQITEGDAARTLIPALTRPEYVTVRYIVPLANNQPAVGYDIYSEPVRRDAINRARASGMMAVTAPIRLVQEQQQRIGILELLPVTGLPPLVADKQPDSLIGFAVGVIKVDEMIDIATKGHVPAGLVLQLIDPHAPDGQKLLYYSGGPAVGNVAPASPNQWKSTLRIGDRDWELSVHATEDYRSRYRPWMAWIVGVAGLVFAALLQMLMLGMTGRTLNIQRENEAIRERMRTETALHESEERFATFMSHLPATAFIKNGDGRLMFINRYCQELFGLQDYTGKTMAELIPGELAQQMTEDDRRTLTEGVISAQETIHDAQGRERIFEVLKFPIQTSGKEVHLGGLGMDITNLKQTEAALRTSLEEKTALLREVHHRVKNNLQIVSSLINLQAGQEKNQTVLAALRDTQVRVRAMAMLHEKLYRSTSLARIDLAAYLEGLCAHLFSTFGTDQSRVKLEYRTTAVELGMDQAVPCGLIVNELVSNALEHAFPEGRSGHITVELRRDAADRLTITVADDGVGLPAGLDSSQTSTLGLQLVNILTTQLKGTLRVDQGQGTTFQVIFPCR